MADWYRKALAIGDTTKRDNETGTVLLRLKVIRLWGYRSLCFASHHPDPVVRLGTRLGMLGAWLGLLALADPVLKVCEHFVKVCGNSDGCRDRLQSLKSLFGSSWEKDDLHSWAMILIALFFGVLGAWLCWGRPRPRRT